SVTGRRVAKPQWLLIKHRDEFASSDELVSAQDTSVDTGRTMEEIAAGKSRVWHSTRASPRSGASSVGRDASSDSNGSQPGASRTSKPASSRSAVLPELEP